MWDGEDGLAVISTSGEGEKKIKEEKACPSQSGGYLRRLLLCVFFFFFFLACVLLCVRLANHLNDFAIFFLPFPPRPSPSCV